jgi:hypothetical protein
MSLFIPPGNNSLISNSAKLLLPAALKKEHLKVRISPYCKDLLRKLSGSHVVLLLNHADKYDPLVTFALSKESNEEFYYLAAREQFDPPGSFRGWLMQQCGAYSVIRGNPEDMDSRQTTALLIEKARRMLVMYPEGDITGRNDRIMPFKKDGMNNILTAQKNLPADIPVWLVPIALFYQVHPYRPSAFNKSILAIENKLGMPASDSNQSLQRRILALIEKLINNLENIFGLTHAALLNAEERLTSICKEGIIKMRIRAGLEPDDSDSAALMLYNLRNNLFRPYWANEQRSRDLELPHQLYATQLDRFQQLLILSSTLAQPFSIDIAWRILDRLETLVLGKNLAKGQRVVHIDVAVPINALNYTTTSATELAADANCSLQLLLSELSYAVHAWEDRSLVRYDHEY